MLFRDLESYTLLSEDGYDLWLALLQFCPPKHTKPGNHPAFEMIPYGLKNSTEILPTILSIIRSYTLYSPEIFSEEFSTEIFKVLGEYLSNMRDDAYVIFISFMDILLINPRDETIDKVVSSGLFTSMVGYVMNDEMNNFLITKMFLLFSRITRKDYFLSFWGWHPDIKANGEKLRYHQLLNQYDQVYSVNLLQLLKTCLIGLKDTLTNDEFNALIQLNEATR
ncbi:hypothetical protein Cantr_01138 [Candida viswanathii]|uniref:Importin-7/11-like TPR repeats domain-containing protein n=1 Tax=Candida viswanathii TaxID=5486 RepID=A0A367YKD6_9ASCO|nr:hypothetical protein Cantr_01138 [Candida viswanathii]